MARPIPLAKVRLGKEAYQVSPLLEGFPSGNSPEREPAHNPRQPTQTAQRADDNQNESPCMKIFFVLLPASL